MRKEPGVTFEEDDPRRFRNAVGNGTVAGERGAGINDQRRVEPFPADEGNELLEIGPVVCDGP